jgi:hypothetical protein
MSNGGGEKSELAPLRPHRAFVRKNAKIKTKSPSRQSARNADEDASFASSISLAFCGWGGGSQKSGVFKRRPCGGRARISAKFRNFFFGQGGGGRTK